MEEEIKEEEIKEEEIKDFELSKKHKIRICCNHNDSLLFVQYQPLKVFQYRCPLCSIVEKYLKRGKEIEELEKSIKQYKKEGKKFNKYDVNYIAETILSTFISSQKYRTKKRFVNKKIHVDTSPGCSIKNLKKHIEEQFLPNMTWFNHGKWHIDHIKPIKAFKKLNKYEEQKKCFHYTNLQPLWAEDNLSKGAKYGNN